MKKVSKKKDLPSFQSDQEAEDFVNNSDLTIYDLSGFEPMKFEFSKKSARLNTRISEGLLDRIKKVAAKKGMPYTRFIREVLETNVTSHNL